VRIAEAALLIAAAASLPAPARAAERHAFAIPPGSLAEGLLRFGEQGDVNIGALDPAVGAARTRGVKGMLPVAGALRRLLAGSGFDYVMIDAHTVRILALPRARHRREAAPAPALPPAASLDDIIVTASKRDAPLRDFPGSVDIVDLTGSGPGDPAGGEGPGTEAALARLPMISTTNLGPARNKLFIAGVADSSFTGPTQSTAGQYLGEVRLTYNAPDPDLNLYDIQRVEVLQGPQGTLYGAGSLGGIIRLVPSPPVPGVFSASLDGGYSVAGHGAPGNDVEGMINLPLLGGSAAARGVAYRSVAGGYIDDALRGLRNVNRTLTTGGRLSFRLDAGGGWIVDVDAVRHDTSSRDSQYAERGLPPLTRESSIAQPFDNDYTLGGVMVRKNWGGLDLVSASGFVRHEVKARYDATGYVGTGPAALDQYDTITLLSNETRLSRHYARGGWVIGASVISDVDRIRRGLGDPDSPPPVNGVSNSTLEAALFGEMNHRVGSRLTVTIGGRLTYTHLSGSPLDDNRVLQVEGERTGTRALPSAGLSWRTSARTLLYLRYQEGYRPGGLALGNGVQEGVQRFHSDRIRTVELGLRYGRPGSDRFTATAAVSGAIWSDIQADLVDALAQPYTANIGDGRILSLEATARWTPTPPFSIEAAIFAADSALKHPAPGFASSNESELPNIPAFGARAGLFYRIALSDRTDLSAGGTLRYVGTSRLGVGPVLDLPQGNYVDSSLGAALEMGGYALSLKLTNVADVRGNRFSLGDPFGVAAGRQITPLRPRTLRFGVHAAF